MRVELMRCQLSLNLAEQKARRLEVQLKEEKKRCDAMRGELDRERKRAAGVTASVSNRKTDKDASITKKSMALPTMASATPFTGSSFDDLPPFAAALAANAEREEMEKQRRLGLVVGDEDNFDMGLDLDLTDFSLDLEVGEMSIEPNDSSVAKSNQQSQASENRSNFTLSLESSNFTTQSTLPSPNITTNYTNLFSTLNNSTINAINSQYTPQYINDDIQTLRQNCILLTHQRATLQQKLKESESQRKSLAHELKISMTSERVLRGLQADWTRRLSETRKEMDHQKLQWEKEHKVEKREWKKERQELQDHIDTLEKERDELTMLVKNQENITFVMTLFCQLVQREWRDGTNRMISKWNNDTKAVGYRMRYGTNRPHRMLTVGGAVQHTQQCESWRDNFVFVWVGGIFRRLKSIVLNDCGSSDDRVSIGKHDQLSCNLTTHDFEATTAYKEEDVNYDESMPLLIRKNPRRSRLYQPQSVFKRRIRNVDSDVPDFMRD
jgi:hypothetical protein